MLRNDMGKVLDDILCTNAHDVRRFREAAVCRMEELAGDCTIRVVISGVHGPLLVHLLRETDYHDRE